MSISRNLCFFPLDNDKLPKCSAILSIIFVFTSSSMCYTLLSSTYHYFAYHLTLMVLFSMHLSYGLTSNPGDSIFFEYRSYHSIIDYMHPYRSLRSCRYSTFTPFSTHTFFLCSGFTSHMLSTNPP